MNQLGTSRSEASLLVNADTILGRSRWLGERRDLIRCKRSSIRTEQPYLEWAKPFIGAAQWVLI